MVFFYNNITVTITTTLNQWKLATNSYYNYSLKQTVTIGNLRDDVFLFIYLNINDTCSVRK